MTRYLFPLALLAVIGLAIADLVVKVTKPPATEESSLVWETEPPPPVVGLARDIDGVDLYGKTMRLSDFRGKVVVLSFWASWCGPCRQLIPYERSLVERLKDKPFALVGVSTDERLKDAVGAAKAENITWPSFWDRDGTIQRRWSIEVLPTLYVLDGKGNVRYRNRRGRELDVAVNTLVTELEKESAQAKN